MVSSLHLFFTLFWPLVLHVNALPAECDVSSGTGTGSAPTQPVAVATSAGGTRTGGGQPSTHTAGSGNAGPPSTTGVSGGTATATSAGPSGTANPPSPCKCGHILSAYDDAYFPLSHTVDFSTVASGTPFSSLGLKVTDGWPVGNPAADGTRCVGSTSNVWIGDGAMMLKVPGGQSAGGTVSGAEVSFNTNVSGGVFTMEARVDPGHGTCQSIFTYTNNLDTGRDEQDIEMLGQSLMTKSDTGKEPGIRLTNWDPSWSGTATTVSPFTTDPSTSYHNYTVGWLSGGTKYYLDGKVLDGPTKWSSVHPSRVIINNWSNGDQTFTQGPPTADVTLRVKSITFYYQTEPITSYPAYPAGCTASDACRI
ncbi:hypothetical protein IAT38_003476 [Cryptococcus sp. DSM 104549]